MTVQKTGVLGYFGYRNAGDDAFYDFWKRGYPSETLDLDQSFAGRSVEHLIFGGGALINKYFFSRVPTHFDRLSFVSCSLPYGPGDAELLKAHADKIALLHFRSKADVEAASEIYPSAEYVPDIIFGHTFDHTKVIDMRALLDLCSLPPKAFDFSKKNLILFLSDHYRSQDMRRFIAVESFKNKLANSLDTLGEFYNLIFIPMCIWYDARDNMFAADVASRMKRNPQVAVIDRYLGPDVIYNVVRQHASLVISMKYHGMIFAAHAGIPFVNIGDTRKNRDLLIDNDLTSLDSNLYESSESSLLSAVKNAEGAATVEKIVTVAAQNRVAVATAMTDVLRLINGST